MPGQAQLAVSDLFAADESIHEDQRKTERVALLVVVPAFAERDESCVRKASMMAAIGSSGVAGFVWRP